MRRKSTALPSLVAFRTPGRDPTATTAFAASLPSMKASMAVHASRSLGSQMVHSESRGRSCASPAGKRNST